MALDILAAKRKSWQHCCEHVLTVRLFALRLQRLAAWRACSVLCQAEGLGCCSSMLGSSASPAAVLYASPQHVDVVHLG